MSTVAITGAGGYIARQLILSLENQEWCRKILGTDIVEPGVQAAKFEFRNYDIRDPLLLDFWKDQGVDTLVHLAFIVDPIHDEKKMYDVNVNGTLNVLRICEELNIGHIIVASSGTAYGAWPDNPESLKEDDPIRIFPPKFSYAHHKGLIEQHCAGFIKQHPDVVFNLVRPCVVYGPPYGQLSIAVFKESARMVDFTSYPWVLDTTRAKTKLGWKPRYTSMETLRIMLETHDYYPVENS